MKLYAMNDLLQNMEDNSRYRLVNTLAHRARVIAVQAEVDRQVLTEKPVTMAMDEAEAGKLEIPAAAEQSEAEN